SICVMSTIPRMPQKPASPIHRSAGRPNKVAARRVQFMSSTGHKFHASVLREYDIRGIVGTTLFPADAYAIGRAYATRILRDGGKTIALGFDGRLSSPELAQAVAEGLLSTGVNVKRVGLGPT